MERRDIIRHLARLDREKFHPEIYADLKNDNADHD